MEQNFSHNDDFLPLRNDRWLWNIAEAGALLSGSTWGDQARTHLPCAFGKPIIALINRSLLSGHSNVGSEEIIVSLSTTGRALHSS